MSQPDRPHRPDLNESNTSFDLPPELAEFLRDKEYACLTQTTDKGTALVMKLPAAEIVSVGGRVPIHIRQELYDHPLVPVIRIVLPYTTSHRKSPVHQHDEVYVSCLTYPVAELTLAWAVQKAQQDMTLPDIQHCLALA